MRIVRYNNAQQNCTYPDGLGPSDEHFRTEIALHLFMAYIFPPILNIYKKLCINVLFVRK